MKNNPKVLYDYINQQKDKDTKIGPLKINNEYIYMMERKFVKFWQTNITQYSSKSKIHKINEEIFVVDNEGEELSGIEYQRMI